MPASASKAHVKIGAYEFLLDESQDDPYVFTEVTDYRDNGIVGEPNKLDLDSDERLLWRMSDWSGGEGARYWSPADPTVYGYSEEATNTFNTQGQAVNVRRRGQMTGRPIRGRPTEVTVTDAKVKSFLAVGDGQCWLGGSKEIFYNDFDTDGSDAWTSKTSNVPSGHAITAMGGSEDWVFYATGDNNSASVYAANVATAGDDVVADSTTAFGGSGEPLRERLCMYNGRLYGWTGRKLFEMDIFDSVTATAVTALTKNANPGYRKVYDTGTNELIDGKYGGSSINSWWADMVASETALYFMAGSRGQTRIYEFKAGIAKPIWFPPIGFTCKSLAVQGGVLFAFGQWGGETSTSHKGGAAWALPLATRQPVHLAWFRENVAQSLHMQEAAPSYGSQLLVAAANTGRIFIYDMETDGVSMLDKLPWDYSASATAATPPSGAGKVGAVITYGEYRVACTYFPRASDSPTKYETYTWEGDGESNRASSNSNHDQVPVLFMPYYDFDLPYETKALHGVHVAYQNEDDSTTSGLKAGQEIEIAYALDNGTYVTLSTITSSTTPSTGVKGRHFIAISSGSSTKKFFQMKYKVTVRGKRTGGTNYQPPIVKDITMEARSLDHDKMWGLAIRLKDDQNVNARISTEKRFASVARTYLRTLKSNKSIVTFLDYYRYQTMHGSAPGTSSTHTVVIHAIEDHIGRNGEGYCRVILKAIKE